MISHVHEPVLLLLENGGDLDTRPMNRSVPGDYNVRHLFARTVATDEAMLFYLINFVFVSVTIDFPQHDRRHVSSQEQTQGRLS